MATFSTPGTYMLMMSADDGVHTVSYDTTVFTVTNAVLISIAHADTDANLTWQGGTAPFVVEQAHALPVTTWSSVATTSLHSATLPMTNAMGVFRVRAH